MSEALHPFNHSAEGGIMQIPSYMDLHLLIRSYSHLQVTEYRDRDTHDNCSLSMCIQSYNRILHHLNHLICTVHISKLQSHPPSNANLHLLSPSYPFHDHIFLRPMECDVMSCTQLLPTWPAWYLCFARTLEPHAGGQNPESQK